MWIDGEYYTEPQIAHLVRGLKQDEQFFKEQYIRMLEFMQQNFVRLGNAEQAEETGKLIKSVEAMK